jgi:hypothetical protein
MNIKDRLEYNINIGNIHAKRLGAGIEKIKPYLPINPSFLQAIQDDQVPVLDMISTRFSRLQDVVGAKIFPGILHLLEEDVTNYRDNLNRLEKLGILSDASWWLEIRHLRNNIIHDYPDDDEYLSENLNHMIKESESLLLFWDNLKEKIIKLNIL